MLHRRSPMLLGWALGALVASSSPAWGASFTLSSAVALSQDGVSGSINPVSSDSGAFLLTNGTVSFATQDVFIVDITLNAVSASVDALGITVGTTLFFLNPAGAGAFDDTGSGDIGPTAVLADSIINFQGLFTFGTPLAAGQTSVRLFVTHSPQGDIAGGETVNFMVSSGTDFTVQGTVTQLPEPGTLVLLLAGGVFALAPAALRARRRG